MSLVHAYDVGNGDMFSIRHDADSCTIIDCNIREGEVNARLDSIDRQRKGKSITRVISTHPDQDHITGLKKLDEHIGISNFYAVSNRATKDEETVDFLHYKKLMNRATTFRIFQGCRRRWLNLSTQYMEEAGLHVLWPNLDSRDFKIALREAENGGSPNNICPIIYYQEGYNASMGWFGDLENDFMERIKWQVSWPQMDIVFAPHHGRQTGKVPGDILQTVNPQLIVIGEAPSEYLNYYRGYNTITQNTAGFIAFCCSEEWTHIYVSNAGYKGPHLKRPLGDVSPHYLGSLEVR